MRRLPLILCVVLSGLGLVACGWSAFEVVDVNVRVSGSRGLGLCVLRTGVGCIYWGDDGSALGVHLERFAHKHGPEFDAATFKNVGATGFATENTGRVIAMRFPLWLPTLAFSIMSFWLWRRQRRRRGGKGFEVHSVTTT